MTTIIYTSITTIIKTITNFAIQARPRDGPSVATISVLEITDNRRSFEETVSLVSFINKISWWVGPLKPKQPGIRAPT